MEMNELDELSILINRYANMTRIYISVVWAINFRKGVSCNGVAYGTMLFNSPIVQKIKTLKMEIDYKVLSITRN